MPWQNLGPPILNNWEQIGWHIPIAGSTPIGYQVPLVNRFAKPEALLGVAGQMLKGLTYCSDPNSGASELVAMEERIRREVPNGDTLAMVTVVEMYDAAQMLKAAAEGVGSLDADKIARWIETHAAEVHTTLAPFSASATIHFLVGSDALVMASTSRTPVATA